MIKRRQNELGKKAVKQEQEDKHMARKQSSAWENAAIILWLVVAAVGFIVTPVLMRMRMNQLQKQIDILGDYMIRTNRNMGVLDNKFNTLHDQLDSSISCTYQVVPQVEGQVN